MRCSPLHKGERWFVWEDMDTAGAGAVDVAATSEWPQGASVKSIEGRKEVSLQKKVFLFNCIC